jgi:homoserine kinase type II
MAVYTHLGAEELAGLIAHYDVGEIVSAKGIAEGVSNSNWLVETTGTDGKGARFILTMYERRIELSDLPFFLGLLDHLAESGCPVPRTIHDRSGAAFRMVGDSGSPSGAGKAVALIEFLPGVSLDHPEPGQAVSVGKALAGIHLASADFAMARPNDLGRESWSAMALHCGADGLAQIDPSLPALVHDELAFLADHWPGGLPRSVVHADLFPDNVLMMGDRVTGLIDFYFACNDITAYDLAVTHAAWCFDAKGRGFRPDIGTALVEGYENVRPLSHEERAALPILARGASLRFLLSRAEDWLYTPADALVTRKDPMDFARRLAFYADRGAAAFAPHPHR